MKPDLISALLGSVAVMALCAGSQAASITYVGTEVGGPGTGYAVENWTNGWVAKNFDIGVTEKYGTAGYYQLVPNTGAVLYEGAPDANDLGITLASMPPPAGQETTAHVKPSFLAENPRGWAGTYVNFPSYSIYRAADGVNLRQQGALSIATPYPGTSPGGSGNWGNVFQFSLGASAGFRIGLAVDSVASGTYAPNYITVYHNDTGTVFSAPLTRDGVPDMVFFDLTGNPGDTFNIALWQNAPGVGPVALSLVTFDMLPPWNQTSPGLLRSTWTDMPHYTLLRTRKDVRYFQPPQENTVQAGSLSGGLTRFIAGRIRGFVTPQESGWYRFWISSGEAAELWLSTVAGNKYHKEYLCGLSGDLGSGHGMPMDSPALWDSYAFQMSREVYLEAGNPYFMESDYQFGHSGYSHVSIAWAKRGGTRQPIPSACLSSYVPTPDDLDDDLPDAWEIQYGLSATDAGGFDIAREGEFGDFDGDGLTNREEYVLNTNPANTDTDGDGESDNDEVNALGSNALVADSINDTLLGEINLGSFVSSSTNWISTSGGLLPNSFRGEVTWNFSVPTAGNWLLRLSAELMGSTYNNETVSMLIKVDGKIVSRRSLHFGSGKFAILQTLTPFLDAGNHQISILVDNMFARRTVRLVSLKILAPANATALLARDNRVVDHAENSRTSPAFLEGYARDEESVTVNGVAASEGLGDGHWFANVTLAAQDGPQAHSIQFESGYGMTGSFTWQATNTLDAETLVIRQGDSLRVGAWNGDPSMTATLASTAGGSWNLTGLQSVVVAFSSPGTFTFTGTLANSTSGTLTVIVCGAPAFPSGEIDVLDAMSRTITCAADSEIAFEAPADICLLAVGRPTSTTASLTMNTFAPRHFGVAARLGTGGPILAMLRVNVIGLSDAVQNDMTSPGLSGIIGYKIYNSPLTVTNLPEGARIEANIYRGGVMFPDGSYLRVIQPADLTNGCVNLQFLFPIGVAGGYCHALSVFDRNGEYLGTR
jgi:hypothetical protein